MTAVAWLGGVKTLMRTALGGAANAWSPPIVVLIYHRVADLMSDPFQLAVSPDNFRAHINWLKRNVRVTEFGADWTATSAPQVVVTFDDGYADNVLHALPILDEVGVPATFFVSTELIDTPFEFWWDELERLLTSSPQFPARELTELFPGLEPRDVNHADNQIFRLHASLMPLDPAERDRRLARFRDRVQLSRDGRSSHRVLSVEQLRQLAKHPLAAIGAHTVTHPRLSALGGPEQRCEIEQSRIALSRIVQQPIEYFSYPFGSRRDYDATSVSLCRELGFAKVASNRQGNWHRGYSLLEIPRHLVRDWPVEVFARQIKRFFWPLPVGDGARHAD